MKAFAIALSALLSGCFAARGDQRAARREPASPGPNPCRVAATATSPAAEAPPAALVAFEGFLREYSAAAPERRSELARAFVERQRAAAGFPIVAPDGTAVFFYLGTGAEREVRLVGDFKTRGFHNVYWDRAGEPMTRAAPDGAVFFARLRVAPDARLDYQLVVDGEARPDPLNPRAIESGAALSLNASELVMPGYELPGELLPRAEIPKGTLEIVEEAWAKPKVTVYLPAGYDAAKKYPVIYTADGSAWVNYIKLPTLLDNLIGSGQIAPVIVVMIDAAEDRNAWYSYNPDYLAYLETVIAYVDRRYATRAEAGGRLHIGTSAGGRATLYAALERPGLFAKAAMLSPAFNAPLYYFEPYLRGEKRLPALQVWLSAGAYEGALCEDTRVVERYFREAGLATGAAYTHEGHSFGTWRRAAVEALKFFFSTKAP